MTTYDDIVARLQAAADHARAMGAHVTESASADDSTHRLRVETATHLGEAVVWRTGQVSVCSAEIGGSSPMKDAQFPFSQIDELEELLRVLGVAATKS